MWRRAGRPGQPGAGYAITDGCLTLIVPYTAKEKGVKEAIAYLNALSVRPVSGKRICVSCNKPMGKADKWWFRPDGRIEHRHCDRPESYL